MNEPVSVSEADVGVVGVDVANALRDPSLSGPVGMRRVERLVEAWRTQVSQHADVRLVVDRSVLTGLSRTDRRRIRQLRRRDGLLIAHDADHALLDLAEMHQGCVLSRDRFLDKRRGRRWVPQRFFTWIVSDNQVKIVRQESRNTQPFEISRKEEQKMVQARGISDLRHPAARRRWVCVSDVPCPTREITPDFLQVLPLLEGTQILCPGCRYPLRDLGPRPAEAEMKLVVDDAVLARFTIHQGETIRFGRLSMPDALPISELAWEGAFDDVGREHAAMRLLGRRLAIRPVDEEHPVWVRSWRSQARLFTRERRLRHSAGFTPVDIRDILLLGERLELHRSGRSIAEAETLGENEPDSGWRSRGTAREMPGDSKK